MRAWTVIGLAAVFVALIGLGLWVSGKTITDGAQARYEECIAERITNYRDGGGGRLTRARAERLCSGILE